jgi:hypothetical protein
LGSTAFATQIIAEPLVVAVDDCSGKRTCGAVYELVQLAAIQPDSAAFGTVVDLHAGSVGDQKDGTVNGTFHAVVFRFGFR